MWLKTKNSSPQGEEPLKTKIDLYLSPCGAGFSTFFKESL
jgi:hypothetical protein